MKEIYITSICKNEMKYIDRYLDSVKDADKIFILDTGSTDGTYEKLQQIAKENNKIVLDQKIYKEFSFEIARNDCLALIKDKKDNLMVQIDFDEYFYQKDWYKILKNFIEQEQAADFFIDCPYSDKSTITLYNMRRVIPCTRMFYGDNFSYDNNVHETIVFKGSSWLSAELYKFCKDIMIYHDPDLTKNRTNYVDLAKERETKCVDVNLKNIEKSLVIIECCRNKDETANVDFAEDLYKTIDSENVISKEFSAVRLYEATDKKEYLQDLLNNFNEDMYYEQNIIYTLLKYLGKDNIPKEKLDLMIELYNFNKWLLGEENLKLSEMDNEIAKMLF